MRSTRVMHRRQKVWEWALLGYRTEKRYISLIPYRWSGFCIFSFVSVRLSALLAPHHWKAWFRSCSFWLLQGSGK